MATEDLTPPDDLSETAEYGAVAWKASTLRLGQLVLVSVGLLAAAATVVGIYWMSHLMPADDLAASFLILLGIGFGLGAIEGASRRTKLKEIFEFNEQPVVPARWGVMVRRYRPPATGVGVAAMLVLGGWYSWSWSPEGTAFMAGTAALGSVIGNTMLWMPMLDRWERRTGHQVLFIKLVGGARGWGISVTRAELDAVVVDGEFGERERRWVADLCASLHGGGWYDEAATLGDRLYRRWGVPEDAYNAACSLTRADDHDLAVEYLTAALHAGFGRDLMVKDDDLQPLLPRPDVMELFKSTAPAAAESSSAVASVPPPGDGVDQGFVHGRRLESEGLGGG